MIDNPDYAKSTIRLLVFQALKHWKDDALFSLLFDKDCIVRSAAAREIQTRGNKAIFEKLLKLINDDRGYVREICAFALGQFGTPSFPYKDKAVAFLGKLLADSDAEVRAAAASAFGHLCAKGMDEDIESKLVHLADDSSDDVRSSVAGALGSSSGSVMVIEALEKLRADKSKEVRSWAEIGLELLSDKERLPGRS